MFTCEILEAASHSSSGAEDKFDTQTLRRLISAVLWGDTVNFTTLTGNNGVFPDYLSLVSLVQGCRSWQESSRAQKHFSPWFVSFAFVGLNLKLHVILRNSRLQELYSEMRGGIITENTKTSLKRVGLFLFFHRVQYIYYPIRAGQTQIFRLKRISQSCQMLMVSY